ncbi:MBL fold metallo-hydrolase [Parapedobacter lycopersici]|uniref:MBL fold metallo-hydrolase n=1 Tax=Parapedobacter lycopersici TaxID=1864939 RepID=UPI0033422F08
MTLFFAIVALAFAAVIFMQQPKFGKMPTGDRLERIKRSPNYKNGAFQNLSPTPSFTDGANFFTVMREFFFGGDPRIKPTDTIPHVETDLRNLPVDEQVLIWFGHSSYFMQVDGKRILVDPVLSGGASPLSFTTRSFAGTDAYAVSDLPPIDYLFITHDHWDHLDHETLKKLRTTVKAVICPLGVGAHLEYWDYDPAIIHEEDWNQTIALGDNFTAYTTPARHFSGRGFRRNQTLWTSYVLQTPSIRIFIGGDSGYDSHFAEIGRTFGGFDLAILENGQYNKSWRNIHTMPDEVLRAAADLKAKNVFPVHSSKFPLATHAWDEPLIKIVREAEKTDLRLLTPMIGQVVRLDDATQVFSHWWEGVN